MNKYLLIIIAAAVMVGFGAFAQNANTFKDNRDGKTYKTVKIDTKVWMAENLNFKAKRSKCYENKNANCAKYGRLYDWATANKACPAGFHLASDDEWTALENTVGGSEIAGIKLKSARGWDDNGNGTDGYGFSALPGGYGNNEGGFVNAGGRGGRWWSATEYDADNGRFRFMFYNLEYVYSSGAYKTNLYSVRCVKD